MRPDQEFFASGACHILAYACRNTYPDRSIRITALRPVGAAHASHVVATWNDWAFDHCGWNYQKELVEANEVHDERSLELIKAMTSLEGFCEKEHHRPPSDYYADPRPRARDYVFRFSPPWRIDPSTC